MHELSRSYCRDLQWHRRAHLIFEICRQDYMKAQCADQVKMAYTLRSQTVLQAPSNGTQRNPPEILFFLEMKQRTHVCRPQLKQLSSTAVARQ